MARRHVPVGRLAVIAALVVGAWAVGHRAGGLRWRALSPGVEFAMLRGEPFCRRGSSGVALLRLDPARVRLEVRHYTLEPDHMPLTIVEWLRRSGALAVFNAGQYYPDLSYMGLLVCDGRVVSDRIHPRFRAALVAVSGRRESAARADRRRLDEGAGPRRLPTPFRVHAIGALMQGCLADDADPWLASSAGTG